MRTVKNIFVSFVVFADKKERIADKYIYTQIRKGAPDIRMLFLLSANL